MTVIIKNKETGKLNSICVCCRDGDSYRWVSHRYAMIFDGIFTSKEAAIEALNNNPKITWEECKLRYEIIKE